ncbi:hypothetical protein CH340_08910 [Rhodoplanes serenus]|nr:hypothetical protein CH340_08910 [Rhodoplanes serenus]
MGFCFFNTAAIAARDKELGTRDAEIAKLKADQLDAAKLDKLVSDRADVLARAKAVVADVDTTGKSIPDIRRAVVAKKLGDAAVKDKSDDYVEALFDGLAKVARPSDPVRDAIGAGLHSAVDADKAAADAYAQMVKDMQSGAVAAKAN